MREVGRMGSMDDANTGPGECPGHTWALLRVHLDLEGLWREYVCRSCGGLLVASPDQEEPDGGLRTW